MKRHLGYMVIKNGAVQRTFNYPNILNTAHEMAIESAARLAAGNTTDIDGSPSIVRVVETFDNSPYVNSEGAEVARWIGASRVTFKTGDNVSAFRQETVR